MKLLISFQTPDATKYAVDGIQGNTEEETYKLMEDAYKVIDKFVKYGELVTIEIDTITQTVKVIPI